MKDVEECGDEEGKIQVTSFISFAMGDVRRPSFIVGAAERASSSFGIRNKCIFEGGDSLITLTLMVCS